MFKLEPLNSEIEAKTLQRHLNAGFDDYLHQVSFLFHEGQRNPTPPKLNFRFYKRS